MKTVLFAPAGCHASAEIIEWVLANSMIFITAFHSVFIHVSICVLGRELAFH